MPKNRQLYKLNKKEKVSYLIKAQNLTKVYGAHTALNNLSFTVEQGKIYGLLGPNGAGKTTTMNIITGYICANEGSVTIDGTDIYAQPDKARELIGYLPENPPLYLDMKVIEYLKFVAEIKNVHKADIKAELALVMEKCAVQDVQNRLIKNLSKGYKQRVGLAAALIGEPPVLILDEPTNGLDPKQIIEIRSLIKSLTKKHTILLSSHILTEISAVCDKVMILNKGELAAFDTPENLIKLYEESSMLCITVKGEKHDIKQALTGIEHAKINDIAKGKEPGTFDVTISYNNKNDIRANVSTKLSNKSLPVLNMSVQNKSLEEVFLKLTATKKDDEVDE